MKKQLILLILLFAIITSANAINFEEFFLNKTMRFDYFHTGNANEEHFAFDEIVCDGIWAGSKTKLIDKLRLGKYFYEVIDAQTGKIIYSRGFASIYSEWETTRDAKENWGVYHESVRFPWPKKNVKFILYKRNLHNTFDKVWEYSINTDAYRVNPAEIKDFYNVYPVIVNGDPENMVDIVILGEGYTKNEMNKFHKDAERYAKVLLSTEPFASRKDKFNIRAVETPSPDNGVNHPHQDIYKRSALSVSYGAFDSERYALAFDNKTIRNAASAVPYDFTVILMNDSIYGGGGIYRLYITAAADNAFCNYLFVHEFGHHFAGLADEYYTSATAYDMASDIIEPWELNVTTHPDKETIKWKGLLTPDTPIPTPWEKEKYDEYSIEIQKKRHEMRKAKTPESIMEKFFIDKKEWDNELLGNMKYSGCVGAFEGAMYMSEGMYRSAPNCIMFTRYDEFCPACERAINLVIDQYTK